MTFHEKLERLTADRIKSVVSRRAGLPATAVSNYLTKQQMPGADVAFRLACALGVSVEWLLDESKNWPPVWAHRSEAQELARVSAA